jgi:outer membrane protein OmpA-like peptidoglycan-associated protein
MEKSDRAHASPFAPMLRRPWVLAIVLALHGCTTTPPPAPPPAPAPAPAAPRASALTTERAWLQSWFTGTPVAITQQNQGAVSVEVPREFSFDAGRSKVNPPLAAVLDKVAQSLRRTGARLALLAAPGDAAAASPLALQRAQALHSHLLSRGVPAAQLGTPSATTVAAVQLRMELAPP